MANYILFLVKAITNYIYATKFLMSILASYSIGNTEFEHVIERFQLLCYRWISRSKIHVTDWRWMENRNIEVRTPFKQPCFRLLSIEIYVVNDDWMKIENIFSVDSIEKFGIPEFIPGAKHSEPFIFIIIHNSIETLFIIIEFIDWY